MLKLSNLMVLFSQESVLINKGVVQLDAEIRSVKNCWQFYVLGGLELIA